MTPLTFPWEEMGKLGSLQKPWALIPFTTHISEKGASSKFGNGGSPKHGIYTLLPFSCIENLHGDISTTQMMLPGGQHQATPVTSSQPLAMQSVAISMDCCTGLVSWTHPPGLGRVFLTSCVFSAITNYLWQEGVGTPCSSATSHDMGIRAIGACTSY